jgi:hypothetical protein
MIINFFKNSLKFSSETSEDLHLGNNQQITKI